MSAHSNRDATNFFTRGDDTLSKKFTMFSVARTTVREKSDDEYCSGASSFCDESEISVSVTCIALRDVQSVSTIIAPAASTNMMLAGAGSLSAPIVIVSLPAARAIE